MRLNWNKHALFSVNKEDYSYITVFGYKTTLFTLRKISDFSGTTRPLFDELFHKDIQILMNSPTIVLTLFKLLVFSGNR